jgi:streptomycin 6-kinase
MNRRRRAHDDRRAVLVHGDVHDLNALQAADGTFKLVDPRGLRAEPACDLGTIVRCNPDSGDDLRARAKRRRPHRCGRHRDLGVGNDPPRHQRPLQPEYRFPAVR